MLLQILSVLLAFFPYLHVDCSTSFSSSFFHSPHLCLPEQKTALLEFKSSISFVIDFGGFPKINSWKESIDCCSWVGIDCNNVTGHVIGIDLSHSSLGGSLDLGNSSLFHLQELQEFSLAHNHFSGSIPTKLFSQLGSLTHLNLSSSGFSHEIPHEISLLSNLVSLDISFNALRFDAKGFDMLARNLTQLRNLVLESIDMSGVTVTSFLNLSSFVERLRLHNCQLDGEFPSEVFHLPYLQHICLAWNKKLVGYLPMTNLSRDFKLLDLSFSGFRGSIPDVFGNLNQLTTLKLSSCNFSGQVPITMFNLTQLRELDLSHNRLDGPLPNHVTQLQLLERFSLNHNLISGRVPSWLFTLPALISFDLSYNKLTGPIEQIQTPSSIQYIDLRSNNIHGPIPSSFFDLVKLREFDLSSNNLSGVIESNMLSKLTSLYRLDLSNNSLLSLIRSDNDVNYSFPNLAYVSFSYCSIKQFPSFFRTSNLERLDLSNNQISGGISKLEADGWEELRMLNLSHNFLTTLERFPGKNLQILGLQSNLLQGSILSTCLNPQISDQPQFLSILLMSDNKLTGNIPTSICSLSSLIILDLSINSLSGTIPECLGYFSSSLQILNLQMNKFYGKIPDSFGSFYSFGSINYSVSFETNWLRDLFLNNNQLEGSLPRSLGNCSSLEVLNFGNNKLTDTFPHWLASLPSLQVLILRSNGFHGSMPNSIASSNFAALRLIDLSRNKLTGLLPTNLFQNLRAMKDVSKEIFPDWLEDITSGRRYKYDYDYHVNVTTKRLEIELKKALAIFAGMDFSYNLFHGKIPEELGELVSLKEINFSHNSFIGPIPQSLGNLVALESLDLSSNKLGDRIPSQLTNLTFLEVLDLSENDLVGPIPHGNQFDTFDNDSYRGNLGLCGLPLSRQCGMKPLAPMTVGHEGFAMPFIWKVAMMGYGCGFVLGLSTAYIVFTTREPWWFVEMIERDWQKKVSIWINRNRPRRK